MKHVEETCSECGKAITRRARANVYHGLRVVCTPCLHKLEAKDQHQERKETATKITAELMEVDDDEPTLKQLRFAEYLGIPSPGSLSKWELSDKITETLAERDERGTHVRYVPVYPSKKGAGPIMWIAAILAVFIMLFCAVLMKR